MRIKFTTNLGVVDASALHMNFDQCRRGMEIEIGSETGKRLVASGIAIECEMPVRLVVVEEFKAVPIRPETESKPEAKPISAESSKHQFNKRK